MASSWLYHFGLDAFSAVENWHHGRRARVIYGLLLARDLAIATLLQTRASSTSLTRATVATAAATDLAAGAALSMDIPTGDFLRDRSLSQFGLAAAIPHALGAPEMSPGGQTLPLSLSVGMQIAFNALWRTGRKESARYLLREGIWSVAVMASVGRLSRCLREAVDAGTEAARRSAAQGVQRAPDQAADEAWAIGHKLMPKLMRFAKWAELAETAGIDRPTRIARLAIAEESRLRCFPDEHTLTVPALAWRILTARSVAAGAASWPDACEPTEDDRYTLPEDWRTVAWLVDHVAANAEGDLVLRTRVLETGLSISVEADHLPHARLGTAHLPAGFSLSEENGRQRIEGELRMQAGQS